MFVCKQRYPVSGDNSAGSLDKCWHEFYFNGKGLGIGHGSDVGVFANRDNETHAPDRNAINDVFASDNFDNCATAQVALVRSGCYHFPGVVSPHGNVFASLEVGGVTKAREDSCRTPQGHCDSVLSGKVCKHRTVDGTVHGLLPPINDYKGNAISNDDRFWYDDGDCDEGHTAARVGGCADGTDCTDCDTCDDDDVVWSGAHIEMTLDSLTPSRTYLIRFIAALRPGYGIDQSFKITVDGTQRYTSILGSAASGSSKIAYSGNSFVGFTPGEAVFTTASNSDGTAVLRIENTSPRNTYPDADSGFPKVRGDKRVFIDDVKVRVLYSAGTDNHGFDESNAQDGSNCFTYHDTNCPENDSQGGSQCRAAARTAIPKWTRSVGGNDKSAQKGIALVKQNCAPWGGLSSGSGANYVALKGVGVHMKQIFKHLVPGERYEVKFLASARPPASKYDGQKLKVLVDGEIVFPSLDIPHGFIRYSFRFTHMPPIRNGGFNGCSSSNKCGKCGGDCDNDGHCEGELKCHQRSTGTGNLPTPGCEQSGLVADIDYCYYQPAGNTETEIRFVNDSPAAGDAVFIDDVQIIAERPYDPMDFEKDDDDDKA